MSKQKKTSKNDLGKMRLPALQERFRQVTGETTRSPNRTFLVRRIQEAMAARRSTGARRKAAPPLKQKRQRTSQTKAAPAPKAAAAGGVIAETPRNRGRLLAMTIEALRAEYLEVVGRPTGSEDRRYLIWKIREAEKGRVPVGPRKPSAAELDMKVLPLRLPAEHIARMDVAWRSHGMRSRMEFLRGALGHYLLHLNAPETAQLFIAAEPKPA